MTASADPFPAMRRALATLAADSPENAVLAKASHSVRAFRTWTASAQADYPWKEHRAECGRLSRDTVGTYVRRFNKELATK